jgi:hypothetical protein
MSEATILKRQRAIARYRAGEIAAAIYGSVGRSREWLYTRVRRHQTSGDGWAVERSRRPQPSPARIGAEADGGSLGPLRGR